MSRERRAEGLAAAARVRREELLELAERLAARDDVLVVEPPAPGTVMLELDAALGAFCLGEVVVTRCVVAVAAQRGFGCVLGFDREGALAAALADAAGEGRAERLARRALDDEHAARAVQEAEVTQTRVRLG